MTVEEILAALQAILDQAASENDRDLTDEEAARYEELETKLVAARRTAEIRKRNTSYNTLVREQSVTANVATAKQDETLDRAFEHYLRTGQENQDLVELRAQSAGTTTAGGYTVPETFRNKLVERMKAYGGVAANAEEITTTGGNPMPFPTIDDTANLAVVTAENTAPVTGADLVFGEKELLAYDYVAPGGDNVSGEGTGLRVSTRLLEDSAFDIQALVSRKLGERIGRAQARDFVTGAGHGSNVPEGVTLNSTTTDTWTAAAPTYDDLIDAIHAVDPAYREAGNCKWYFNDATMALIEKIKDSNNDPVWRPLGALIGDAPSQGTLLGYPVVIDQAFANYTDGGAAKFGAFGNLRAGYVVRRVRDIHVVVDPYTRAAYRQVVYTVWSRADGIIQDPYAYAVLKND